MEYNLEVRVALVVVAANIYGALNTKLLLLKDKILPTAIVKDSISDTINSLVRHHIKVEPNWVRLVQGGIIDRVSSNKQITLTFGCMIPEEIEVSSETSWFSIGEILQEKQLAEQDLEAIQSICQKL